MQSAAVSFAREHRHRSALLLASNDQGFGGLLRYTRGLGCVGISVGALQPVTTVQADSSCPSSLGLPPPFDAVCMPAFASARGLDACIGPRLNCPHNEVLFAVGTYPRHRRRADRPLRWTRQPLPCVAHAVMEWTFATDAHQGGHDSQTLATLPPGGLVAVWINPALVPAAASA